MKRQTLLRNITADIWISVRKMDIPGEIFKGNRTPNELAKFVTILNCLETPALNLDKDAPHVD
jgi:hypothetical protein